MGYLYQLQGRIDSVNAGELEKNLFEAYEKEGELSIDAGELEYISSAGLRVLLKLRKKQSKLEILNVSNDVYEILEVTGFTDLLEVKKRLRYVSVDNCELIGKGGNGSVYRISEDEIIKVYTEKTPVESIENEQKLARSAFVAGVPTAIAYDMVKTESGYGLVFEMVKADVIARKFMEEPENFDEYAKKYAELFKTIHSVNMSGSGLPSTKSIYLSYLDKLSDWYDEEELKRLSWFIEEIPDKDTMVHGDFHTNNIMVQGDELLIIDMAEISYGNPIYDLASSYYAHVLNPRQDPESVMRYLNVTPEIAMKLWEVIMKVYFQTDDREMIDRYNKTIEGFCLLKAALIPAIWVNMPDEHKKRSVQAAKEYFFPQMEALLSGLDELSASFAQNTEV